MMAGVITETYDHGHLLEQATVPDIPRRFRSDLHTPANYVAATQAEQGDLIDLAVSGRKPVSFITVQTHATAQRIAARAIAQRRNVQLTHHQMSSGSDNWWNLTISLTGRVNEHIDIDALCADYTAWSADQTDRAQSITDLLQRAGQKDFSKLMDFASVETHPTDSQDQLAVTGMLLGYPPASTAALIGLPGCHLARQYR